MIGETSHNDLITGVHVLENIQECTEKVRTKIENQTHFSTGQGNSAKVYCLNIVHELLASNQREKAITILDLGCGRAQYIRDVLERHPNAIYVGVEPNKAAAKEAAKILSKLNATIIEDEAYFPKKLDADIVLSFSVLEHVYKRMDYFRCIRANLAVNGVALMNYDSGHFNHPSGLSDRILNFTSPILAKFGSDKRYQRFVKESEFEKIAVENGLAVVESMSFNTDLKEIFKLVDSPAKEEFSIEWLKFELKMNKMGLNYTDDISKYIRTRNHIIVHNNFTHKNVKNQPSTFNMN